MKKERKKKREMEKEMKKERRYKKYKTWSIYIKTWYKIY